MKPRHQRTGSALILVVALLAVLFVLGMGFLMMSRLDRSNMLAYQKVVDTESVVDAVAEQIRQVLSDDLWGGDDRILGDGTSDGLVSDEPWDAPFTNNTNPGYLDDMWLADTFPENPVYDTQGNVVSVQWLHITNLGQSSFGRSGVSEVSPAYGSLDVDTDRDGANDAVWQLAPGGRYRYAVRIIDLCSMVNLNVATRSNVASLGRSPGEIDAMHSNTLENEGNLQFTYRDSSLLTSGWQYGRGDYPTTNGASYRDASDVSAPAAPQLLLHQGASSPDVDIPNTYSAEDTTFRLDRPGASTAWQAGGSHRAGDIVHIRRYGKYDEAPYVYYRAAKDVASAANPEFDTTNWRGWAAPAYFRIWDTVANLGYGSVAGPVQSRAGHFWNPTFAETRYKIPDLADNRIGMDRLGSAAAPTANDIELLNRSHRMYYTGESWSRLLRGSRPVGAALLDPPGMAGASPADKLTYWTAILNQYDPSGMDRVFINYPYPHDQKFTQGLVAAMVLAGSSLTQDQIEQLVVNLVDWRDTDSNPSVVAANPAGGSDKVDTVWNRRDASGAALPAMYGNEAQPFFTELWAKVYAAGHADWDRFGVELYNPYAMALDVSGWQIKCGDATVTLNAGTTIPSASRLLVRNAASCADPVGGAWPPADIPSWRINAPYATGAVVRDPQDGSLWICTAPHTSKWFATQAVSDFATARTGQDAGRWATWTATVQDQANLSFFPSRATDTIVLLRPGPGSVMLRVDCATPANITASGSGWCAIPQDWNNASAYAVGNVVSDPADGSLWFCATAHTSAVAPATFAADRAAKSRYWLPHIGDTVQRGDTSWAQSQDKWFLGSPPVWAGTGGAVYYAAGAHVMNVAGGLPYVCLVSHFSYSNSTFAWESSQNPTWWARSVAVNPTPGTPNAIPATAYSAARMSLTIPPPGMTGDNYLFDNLGELHYLLVVGPAPDKAVTEHITTAMADPVAMRMLAFNPVDRNDWAVYGMLTGLSRRYNGVNDNNDPAGPDSIGELRLPGLVNVNTAPPAVLRVLNWYLFPYEGQWVGVNPDKYKGEPWLASIGQAIYNQRKTAPFTNTATLAQMPGMTTPTATIGATSYDMFSRLTFPYTTDTNNYTSHAYSARNNRAELKWYSPPSYNASQNINPHVVAGDMNDKLFLFDRISNVTTVRSDAFLAYVVVQSVDNASSYWSNDQTTNRTGQQRRYVLVFDRSRCNYPPGDPRYRSPLLHARSRCNF